MISESYKNMTLNASLEKLLYIFENYAQVPELLDVYLKDFICDIVINSDNKELLENCLEHMRNRCEN